MPDAAKALTDEGAKAFVKYFIDVHNDASVRPRTGRVSALSAESCKSCKNLEGIIGRFVKDSTHLRVNPWGAAVIMVSRGPDASANARLVSVRVIQAENDVVRKDGSVSQPIPAETGLLAFELSWAGAWKVSELTLSDEVVLKK